MYRYLILLLVLFVGPSWAHEWTPTYPKFTMSYVSGIQRTNMELFNSRKDVRFYEIGVFDSEWNKVPFATESKVVQVKHLERKKVVVYVRDRDTERAEYVCSKSKMIIAGSNVASIASRICSKFK